MVRSFVIVRRIIAHIAEFPKLLCLLLSCILATVLFYQGAFQFLHTIAMGYGALSFLLAGLLFSFGFTSPFAIAMFVEMAADANILIVALIGGFGALLADMSIFGFARFSMRDEFRKLHRMRLFRHIHSMLQQRRIPDRMRAYLLWSIAGLVIASPVPDEIGVSLLSSVEKIDERRFALLCFVFNTGGILIIMLLARFVS